MVYGEQKIRQDKQDSQDREKNEVECDIFVFTVVRNRIVINKESH
jgi:hypothetical protein